LPVRKLRIENDFKEFIKPPFEPFERLGDADGSVLGVPVIV
jgi:hypothetical protein